VEIQISKAIVGNIMEIPQGIKTSRHWWLTLVILAIWEAEMRRTVVQGQHRKIVWETPLPK
jgi:hypothetical protein